MRRYILWAVICLLAGPTAAQPAPPPFSIMPATAKPALEPLTVSAPTTVNPTSTLIERSSSGPTANDSEREIKRQVLELTADQCQRLLNAVAPSDAADMRFALGQGQRFSSEADQQQFNLFFSKLIIKKYQLKSPVTKACEVELLHSGTSQRIKTPQVFTKNAVLDTHTQLVRATVNATVTAIDETAVPMLYSFEKNNNGYWNIVGLSIAGQPLEDLYRAQYTSLLRDKGAASLFAYIAAQ